MFILGLYFSSRRGEIDLPNFMIFMLWGKQVPHFMGHLNTISEAPKRDVNVGLDSPQ